MAYLTVHGGDIYSYMAQTGEKPLDYSANINPLGMPREVKKSLVTQLDRYCDYPDIHCRELGEVVARYEGINQECLLFGNGAADLIFRICYGLKPQNALLLAPTFAEYGQALSSVDCNINYYVLKPENKFSLSEDILEYIKGNDILFLCNPNNPTGNVIESQLLYRIAECCKINKCILIMDECFMDFVQEKEKLSLKEYLKQNNHVIILKAFTKIFAMPGLRLGYCLTSNPSMRKKIEDAGQSWSVSTPAQRAGVAALKDDKFVDKTIEVVTRERKYLTKSLRSMGFTVYDSVTNFILFQTDDKDLYQELYKQGILIRKCENFNSLDSSYYRIAVKNRKDNIRFIKTIREVLNNG